MNLEKYPKIKDEEFSSDSEEEKKMKKQLS
jgi:hypothetical protein